MKSLITALGVDDIMHCVDTNKKDLSKSECSKKIPIKKVNPDFSKIKSVLWCYECSDLLHDNDY